jgi:hypothetical protein
MRLLLYRRLQMAGRADQEDCRGEGRQHSAGTTSAEKDKRLVRQRRAARITGDSEVAEPGPAGP